MWKASAFIKGLKRLEMTCLLCHSSCGSGIQAQFSLKTLCLKVSHEAAIELLTRVGVSSAGLTGKGPIS